MAISLSVTRLHLPHAIVVILTPKTVGTLALSVGFSIQEETMNIEPSCATEVLTAMRTLAICSLDWE